MTYFLIKDVEISNFADDNTIYTAMNSKEELIKILEKEQVRH